MSTQPSAPASSTSRALAWIFGLLAVVGLSLAGYFWKQQAGTAADQDDAAPRHALYFPIEPVFVVNLADEDGGRYLQAEVQLLTHDAPTLAAIEHHAPAIRNRLLLLFGEQQSSDLRQRAAKETLQAAALAEVRTVLDTEGAPADIAGVIFTSLVTQ